MLETGIRLLQIEHENPYSWHTEAIFIADVYILYGHLNVVDYLVYDGLPQALSLRRL